ncbi:phloretin 4'-O-glucosyltransferase-like [Henckelia pumila]|uniref:phloretin 4'-O-glucosyltransferase-like n=1 Tax=Henckelia pumila TaxID=405737 RepID=UPI003C6E48B9
MLGKESKMKQHHFLIISIPLQSHINPLLQLAKNLSRGGANVTFATTISGLRQIQDRLPHLQNLSYVSFSDGHDEEKPFAGGDFSRYLIDLRRVGSQDVVKLLHKFAGEGQPATCLVYSFLLPWVAAVAREMGLASAFLAIQSAATFAIIDKFFNRDNGIYVRGIYCNGIDSSFSCHIQSLPLFSFDDMPAFLLPDHPFSSIMIPMLREHVEELEKGPESFVFLNTFEELEQEAIKEFDQKYNVFAVGPLIPSAFSDGNDSTDKSFGGDLCSKTGETNYFEWLDSKQERSVVFVAFGSIVVLNKEQQDEILNGLVESGRPFLCVIRPSKNQEEEEMLKIQNDGDHGLIVPWCSQIEVLSHGSIGCFVTHCGWNSVSESIVSGVPMVGFPQTADQFTNAKLVEEVWAIGVKTRTKQGNVVERGELKECLDVVMGDDVRGKEIRKNACKLKDLAVTAVKNIGGSTYKNFKRILEH